MSTDHESPTYANETPPETDDPKTLKAPNDNITSPPKPDGAETLKDPIANKTPPETKDAKTVQDPKTKETPPPENDDPKPLKDPKTNEIPTPKNDDPKPLKDPNTNETPSENDDPKPLKDPNANETPTPKNDYPKPLKDPNTNETPSENDDPKPLKDPNTNETPSENDDPKPLKDPNTNETPTPKNDYPKPLKDPNTNETPSENDDPKPLKDPKTNETPTPKNDNPKPLKHPNTNETPSENDDPKPLKDPNTNETPTPENDDPKPLKDPNTNETPTPENDDPKPLKDPNTNETPSENDDPKPLKDPNTNETPSENVDPKPLKDPNTNETSPPKGQKPDDVETIKDPIANETPPQTNDSKTVKDPKTNETPPPENDDPKPLKDPNTNATPPKIEDTENIKDPNGSVTPPPKPDDPITFEDSETNETPPPKPKDSETLQDPNTIEPPSTLETKTSSENHPTTEDVETLKQAPATDADPHVQQAPPLENVTTNSSSSSHPNYVPAQVTTNHGPEIDGNHNEISPADDEKTTSKQPSLTKNDFPKITSDADPRPKKTSSRLWDKARMIVLNSFKKKTCPKPSVVDKSTKDEKEIELPSKLKKAIQDDVDHTEKGAIMLSEYKEQLNKVLKEIEARQGPVGDDLRKLQRDLIKLRLQITLKYKDSFTNFDFTSKAKQAVSIEVLDMMPQLHNDPFFETSPEFKDFEDRYEKLELKLKLCLLCFSIFPENVVIKKRVMVQWWVSEGFAPEKVANDYFIQLIKKGFIEPENEDTSFIVGSCRMHPFYRSALVMLAERAKFLNFDPKGRATQNFSGSFRSCLVGEGLISYEDLKDGSVEVLDLEKVHLLININEAVLEFKKNWFSKMRNVNFLYLGRWEASATGHREVDDTVFLEELKNMSYVKFLSLQGVSNMINLPESVLKLTNLEILDIRACHNLETIPKKIGLLKWLTHLDMSECYLLEHMPKDISLLKGLRVLKGFVVGKETRKNKSCTLDDLAGLTNLVKLCIYTGLRQFPDSRNIVSLGNLTGLRKLTISWGGNAFKLRNDAGSDGLSKTEGSDGEKDGFPKTGGLPLGLEKLDLRYFPTSKTPNWLKVGNLKGLTELKRFYIRAGKFSDLGQYQESDNWDWPVKKDVWKVEVLRLRYLPEIEMEWRQVQELFPELVYLEQVGCPRLSLVPCDANGVWRKPK